MVTVTVCAVYMQYMYVTVKATVRCCMCYVWGCPVFSVALHVDVAFAKWCKCTIAVNISAG